MQDILINWTPQETRVAVIENGAVQELHVERALERGLVGNIYAGRVVRVLPGMQSAFIDIGLERAAFLHVADVQVNGVTPRSIGGAVARGDHANGAAPQAPIERLVFEGQTLTVQVIKDPIGTKGARLTTQISIAGRLLVFLPQDDHIGISQKIGSSELREQLRKRMAVLAQVPDDAGPAGGFILRTNAEEASDDELSEDIRYLRKTWRAVREQSFKMPPGSLLHQDLSLVERVLRDLAHEATQAIRIDSRLQYEQLLKFGQAFTPSSVQKLAIYDGERPIFDLFNIDDEIARALMRRVDLKSGGYLIIDQTEALTTVDVNTGGFVGGRNFDETIFKTNLEAGQAIARQLRLRNLGGIIIIDFIDMTREEHQAAVLAELRKQLARDRTKITVSGFTQLGLVERVLRDLAHDATQTIRIDSRLQYEQLLKFGQAFTPSSVQKLAIYDGERPIFDLFNIDDEIARALMRRVDLKSGGYLIIDQTEALTTVDVNTGGFVGGRNFDETIFKTNLEAGQAIARQLRLRNLGGIIIIDFIDMTREEHQAAVLAELRKQLARDRTKITVSGFTQLGLVEMTRKRTRESLAHMLCEACPTCEGRGQVKTARSTCYDILREILREARQFDPKEFRIIASASVVEMLLDEESQHLAGLSDFIGKPISLQAEPLGSPERYDIVLM